MKKRLLLMTAFAYISALCLGAEMKEELIVSEASGGAVRGIVYKADNFHEMATLPGFSINAPSGLVPSWGVIFGGLGGTTNSDQTDGSLAVGMGFGDAEKIGGAVSLGIGSIDPRDGGALNRGSLNMNIGHHFKSIGAGVSAGVTGIDLWHDNGNKNLDPSFYGAVTKLMPNDYVPLALTAGLGNNGYVGLHKKGDAKDNVGGFVALAGYIMPQLSLIADYTTEILSFGMGIVPCPQYPVSITLGINDVTEQIRNKPSFIGSLSAAYVF